MSKRTGATKKIESLYKPSAYDYEGWRLRWRYGILHQPGIFLAAVTPIVPVVIGSIAWYLGTYTHFPAVVCRKRLQIIRDDDPIAAQFESEFNSFSELPELK